MQKSWYKYDKLTIRLATPNWIKAGQGKGEDQLH